MYSVAVATKKEKMLNFCTAFLAHSAVFKGIPAQEIDKAVSCLHGFYRLLESGQEVHPIADTIPYAGIVITGCIHVEQIGIDGKIILLKQVQRGDLFGAELSCLELTNPFLRMVSAQKSKVLFINVPSAQNQTCRTCPYKMTVLENILREVARDAVYLNLKIQLLSQPTLRDKLLFYLNVMHDSQHSHVFTIPFTREKLAQFICADRSAVSRELSRMQREGIITIEGKQIKFLLHRQQTVNG